MAQPENLLYSKEHEWVKVDGDVATIGITDYAQNSLGDIVYVELPKVGAKSAQFGNVGVIESVKAVSDLFTPISGEVVEINAALDADPASVNRAPYGERLALQSAPLRRRRDRRTCSTPPTTRSSRRCRTSIVYTPHTERDIAQMLDAVGVGSLDELLRVPDALALRDEARRRSGAARVSIARRFDAFAQEECRRRAIVRFSARARTGTTCRRRFRRWRCAASF